MSAGKENRKIHRQTRVVQGAAEAISSLVLPAENSRRTGSSCSGELFSVPVAPDAGSNTMKTAPDSQSLDQFSEKSSRKYAVRGGKTRRFAEGQNLLQNR